MNRIPIRQVVIVEGKYDKITLENIIDTTIVPCEGFGIFKNKDLQAALRAMALRSGAILLTDSDRAGGVIRAHLQRILQGAEIYMLYVPAVAGKERRKEEPSKEGLLGVEGTDPAVLRALFAQFRAEQIRPTIFAADLYALGFSGTPGSKARKERLLQALLLPPRLSGNALLKELNRRFDRDSFYALADQIK